MAAASRLYMKSLGCIFSIAFISYYVQYPALSSRSGIEPSEGAFKANYPQIYDFVVAKGHSDADSFAELLALLGLFISVAIVSGVAQHGLLFLAVTYIYQLLVTLGRSFYTFQWDILLVETGILTGLCFAPWTSTAGGQGNQGVGSWPLRFLLFKLMFMSGIVKIQANCPTWQNLTALEYHFATQCLPGPLAWYAHQLPPLLLRLGVAATFVIEIPAAFLLIAPSVAVRKVGAWLQILLQILIILTGSYNFFNLLTIALCIPCMIEESSYHWGEKRYRMYYLGGAFIFLCKACQEMFSIGFFEDRSMEPARQVVTIQLSMASVECDVLLERVIPFVVAGILLLTLYCGAIAVRRNKNNRLSSLVNVFVCCFCISATAVPLFDLPKNASPPTLLGYQMSSSAWRDIRVQTRNISHGYGLFRRMTGVGQQSTASASSMDAKPMGWAGLPPSIVARPEIIVEAMIDDSDEWRELNFRWKPGNVDRLPLQAAPHQPRFDWRMWFAALGTINHNAWLVSFIDKILAGCPVVLDLLKEPEIAARKQNITKIRANLYHYDFTRLDTEWSRRIPGVKILDDDSQGVWTRQYATLYLPPLEKDNESLRQFLQQTGYGQPLCDDVKDRCRNVESTARVLCRVALLFRQMTGQPWVLPLAAFTLCILFNQWSFSRQLKAKQEKLKIS